MMGHRTFLVTLGIAVIAMLALVILAAPPASEGQQAAKPPTIGFLGAATLSAWEIVPGASRVALLLNPSSPNTPPQLRQTEAAARALGMQLVRLEARPGEGLDRIFRVGIEGRIDALVVITDFLFYGLRAQVAKLGLKHRLPTVSGFGSFADAGGLSPTARPTSRTTAAPRPTWIVFLKAPSRPICRSSSRLRSNW